MNGDVIRASLSEPHIYRSIYVGLVQARLDELNGRNLHVHMYVYWYVRHPRAADINVQQCAIISRGRIGKFGDFSSGHAPIL